MRAFGLTATFCALLLAARMAVAVDSAVEGEAVVAPGQEGLLAELLGQGAQLPDGCAFSGGGVEGGAIKGIYRCPDGEVVIELRHPSAAPAAPMRTERFAITFLHGAPPPALADAIAARIRSREADFEWTRLAPPPTPLPPAQAPVEGFAPPIALLAAAGLLTLAALWWMAPVLRRGARAALRRLHAIRRDRWAWAAIAILVASAVARAWLAVVNWHSNDDHFSVAQMIRDAGWQPPPSSACFECSHAKLYHYTLAGAFSLARSIADIESISSRSSLLVGNLLNFAAFTVLLAVLVAFFRSDRWSKPVRVLALAFAAFNAGLIGIFSQTTNDGFCILFASLAIFSLGRFFADLSMKAIVAATVFLILAALSKASGWAIFGVSVAVLILKLFGAGPTLRRKYAAATAVLVLGFLAVVPFVNPYRENFAQAGTPFVNDAFDVPLLKVEVPRPPSWPLQTFFTFRYLDLLRVPYNQYGVEGPYPLHRESLWSQVYGRTFFLRFDQNIWQNTDPRLLFLGRLCLMLGLLPLAALLVGTAGRLRALWRGVSHQGLRWFAEDGEWHHLVFVAALLAALIALIAENHRLALMFNWMKAFYLFPAILSFLFLFLCGLELLWRRYPKLVTAWMVLLVVASVADVGWLIHDLRVSPAP